MALITLNGNSSLQPSALTETYKHIYKDRTTITGKSRRIWLAQKREVTMKFEAITQTQYDLLNSMIQSGSSIAYVNTTNTWNFSGFATQAADEYMRGASLLRNVTLVILEI